MSVVERDKQALSDITVFNKYAKFIEEFGRRENWEEIVTRNMNMHITKYPTLEEQIRTCYKDYVLTKRILPSMRSLQFGGRPIEMSNSRMFNCAYAPAESPKFFSELMFLLLGGTGMGYSVQQRHVGKLPVVRKPETIGGYTYQVQDSIIGWADAVKTTVKAFFSGSDLPEFDYRDIRDKGSELVTTGGKAPGAEPLKACINNLVKVLTPAAEQQRKLRPIEVHDMACIIADAVLAGGIRRAAMICLFDRTNEEMLTCKATVPVMYYSVGNMEASGVTVTYNCGVGLETAVLSQYDYNTLLTTNTLPWYIAKPARARANNSAVLLRGAVTQAEFYTLMQRVDDSKCGEPGVYWTNNLDWGTNPCCEIALEPYQMCNLTEINAGVITTQKEFNDATGAATFIGTLQAGYTAFHYLNPKWKETCNRGALLGVSMTGIAAGSVVSLNLVEAAKVATEANKYFANLIGINPAERVTCVKPAGTTSLVLGVASGIHSWHNDYYIRRMRAGKDEALAQYLMRVAPKLVEQDVMNPKQVVLSFPQKAPAGACVRTEPMMELLNRVKKVSQDWVQAGHVIGHNTHNVSCTISVKDDEWGELVSWMWKNRNYYNGISVLPYFGAEAYPQLPFEDCTEEQYNELLPLLDSIDIGAVFEQDGSGVDLAAELACAGGVCELK